MDKSVHIPGYRLERELGHGGMATVYLAVQESVDREVALKVMATAFAGDRTFKDRFLKETRIVARLVHPHIVTVYDGGEHEGHHYIAMEYVGGGDLKRRIRAGLTPERALAIARQIASALGYAHRQQIVHRDVKPENILFRDEDTAVLSDFGIAKAVNSTTRMTSTGMSIGTPHYMSPEQVRGGTVDGRSDIYSLGVVLYQMLVGKLPYDAADSFAVGIMHINEPVPRLVDHLARYQQLLDRMLAKDAADRFADAGALIQALDCAMAGQPLDETETPTELMDPTTAPMGAARPLPSGPALALGPDTASASGAPAPMRRARLWPWVLVGLAVVAVLGIGAYRTATRLEAGKLTLAATLQALGIRLPFSSPHPEPGAESTRAKAPTPAQKARTAPVAKTASAAPATPLSGESTGTSNPVASAPGAQPAATGETTETATESPPPSPDPRAVAALAQAKRQLGAGRPLAARESLDTATRLGLNGPDVAAVNQKIQDLLTRRKLALDLLLRARRALARDSLTEAQGQCDSAHSFYPYPLLEDRICAQIKQRREALRHQWQRENQGVITTERVK